MAGKYCFISRFGDGDEDEGESGETTESVMRGEGTSTIPLEPRARGLFHGRMLEKFGWCTEEGKFVGKKQEMGGTGTEKQEQEEEYYAADVNE